MLALFYIFIAVAVALIFWQAAKISTLKKKIKIKKNGNEVISYVLKENPIANARDNDNQGKLYLAFMIGFYALMVYCLLFMNDMMLPESASVEGEHDDNLFLITFTMIGVVQFIVQAILFYFAYKYRGVSGKKAFYYVDNHKLEIIWTAIPAIALTLLIGYGLWAWNHIMDLSDTKDPILIEVYAKQFSWEARYAGGDNELGRADVRLIEGLNTMGVDVNDKHADDDIPVTELHLPKGRKVVFKFRSQDVLHSAYMPHFRAQMNCVPGMITEFGFTPKFTTEEMRVNPETIRKINDVNKVRKEAGDEPYVFDYLLLCNKICGASHYNMQMKIIVEEEYDFHKWLAEQKKVKELYATKSN